MRGCVHRVDELSHTCRIGWVHLLSTQRKCTVEGTSWSRALAHIGSPNRQCQSAKTLPTMFRQRSMLQNSSVRSSYCPPMVLGGVLSCDVGLVQLIQSWHRAGRRIVEVVGGRLAPTGSGCGTGPSTGNCAPITAQPLRNVVTPTSAVARANRVRVARGYRLEQPPGRGIITHLPNRLVCSRIITSPSSACGHIRFGRQDPTEGGRNVVMCEDRKVDIVHGVPASGMVRDSCGPRHTDHPEVIR